MTARDLALLALGTNFGGLLALLAFMLLGLHDEKRNAARTKA